jgi:hypothetical protein
MWRQHDWQLASVNAERLHRSVSLQLQPSLPCRPGFLLLLILMLHMLLRCRL